MVQALNPRLFILESKARGVGILSYPHAPGLLASYFSDFRQYNAGFIRRWQMTVPMAVIAGAGDLW